MTIEEWFERAPVTTAIVGLGLLALTGVVFYAFARMLIGSVADSATVERPVTMLMWILGILSIVALIGGLFTKNEQAFTIAATGVGAFAGALTARAQAVIPGDPENPKPPRVTGDETVELDVPSLFKEDEGV